MAICSTFRITFDTNPGPGTVLLEYEDHMESEVEIENEQVTQLEPLIRSASPFLEGRQNVSRVIRWNRFVDHADHWTARTYLFSHSHAFQTLSKEATVELFDENGLVDAKVTYTTAVLNHLSLRVVSSERTLANYQMTVIGGSIV